MENGPVVDGWLTTRQAADELRVTSAYVKHLAALGKLPYHQVEFRGARFFNREEVEIYKQAHPILGTRRKRRRGVEVLDG